MSLDMKDRRIIYELDRDSRQSFSQIGKTVGLKKDVVAYRIKKLEDEKIITSYYTVIDAYRLGYLMFRYYINFQYITPGIRREIIDYFSNYKNICTVGSVVGKYDLVVVIWVKNVNDFYQFWNTALNNFGNYFETRVFSVYIRGIGFRHSFIMQDKFSIRDREIFEKFGVGNIVDIDEFDYKLLNVLALNARLPLIELATQLDSSSQTIGYRIRKLIKNGVIQRFRVNIDVERIGFKRYKVDIYLKEHQQKEAIIEYIRKNPHVFYISTSVGLCDLEVELIVRSSEQIVEILEDINVNFPNVIKNYGFYGDFKPYKETFLPKLFE
jgi:Lrp/AsnC family transcriptional regulator for asnA, asnC and gidA